MKLPIGTGFIRDGRWFGTAPPFILPRGSCYNENLIWVNQLLNPRGDWNQPLINHNFGPPEAARILQIQIGHCLFSCPIAMEVWQKLGLHLIPSHLQLQPPWKWLDEGFQQILSNSHNTHLMSRFVFTLWTLWLARNLFVFEGTPSSPEDILSRVGNLSTEFLPTPINRRMKNIDRLIKASLKDIINIKEKALKAGETSKDDLLGIMLESNHKEIEEHGHKKNIGMSLEDVIDECTLFYFAGQETTSVLLVWTMVLLSKHSYWQEREKEEVLQVFGSQKPHLDGLNRLKMVSMILYEVLRLYPPALGLTRSTDKEMKLGELTLLEGVHIYLPIVLVHHDIGLWGEDAKQFNPERFSKGIFKATNGKASFFPFGWGPRICTGQNFSLMETKLALSLILQHFLLNFLLLIFMLRWLWLCFIHNMMLISFYVR
ncbi:hypothetical protein PIB30_031829 [Stylosanthes scabra]|uniref:11-oxo-beta-amyrin 30-oxidase n=1 Tax=Stylosanthes scabra TaxID=79078 RepID=A0ABU6RC47_9FABA|nr:hypothetical protein [Stylosanthes scabra]